MDYFLKCLNCKEIFDNKYNKQKCSKCNGLLEVEYKKFDFKIKMQNDFWSYEKLLPKSNYKHYEIGGTKLLKSSDYNNLFLKLENQNPTRSFKDRGSVVEIAKALEYGYKEVVCASTGNMAFSVSYFAKLNKIKSKIFISNNANKDKIEYIRSTHDANITQINGDFNKAQEFAEKYAKKQDVFLTGDYCYRKEGQRTMVYEIISSLKPDYIIIPIGNATLISGILKGLNEMKLMKIIDYFPTIIGVEAELCNPFEKAYNSGNKIKYQKPKTKADAIAVGYPTFGENAIQELKKIKGIALNVTEKEMEEEQKLFYENYGIVAELAGVASIAAFKKLKLNKNNKKAVAIISGGNK